MSEPLIVTDRIVISADELVWTAVRASGPGGQNVNKVATKVELRFDVRACGALDAATKARLLALAANRLDAQGMIVLTCQETRTQRRNLELARERLADLVRAALIAPKKRRRTRPTRGSQQRRLDAKKHRGRQKLARSGRDED